MGVDDSEEGPQVESHASGKVRLECVDASHGTVVVRGNREMGGLIFLHANQVVSCWSGLLVTIIHGDVLQVTVDSIMVISIGVSSTSNINIRLGCELGGVVGNDMKREVVEEILRRNRGTGGDSCRIVDASASLTFSSEGDISHDRRDRESARTEMRLEILGVMAVVVLK